MSLEVVGVNALLIKCSTFLSLISQGEGVWVNLKILFRIQHRVLLLKRSSYHYLVTGNVQAFCFWCKKGLFRVYQPATRLAWTFVVLYQVLVPRSSQLLSPKSRASPR